MESVNVTPPSANDARPSGNDAPTSSTKSTTHGVDTKHESGPEDPVGELFRRPITVLDGTGVIQEIKGVIDTGSKCPFIALKLAQQLQLTLLPMLERAEFEGLNGQPLVAPCFVSLNVCFPNLHIPWKELHVYVVEMKGSGFLLLGTLAIHKLALFPKILELEQSPSPASTNPGGEGTSSNGNQVLVIFDTRRTKEQNKHDEDVRQKNAGEAARLAEIRVLHGSNTSVVGRCNSSSGSSSTSSSASRSLSSVFSKPSTRASEATTIISLAPVRKIKG
ncbi:hypothetical protein F4823DRAFT_22824 [Ustulina deusta]|nr:hypothetical protein F4823DRAFT_22824 [Ustulina deusta]